MIRLLATLLMLCALVAPAGAVICEKVSHKGDDYTVCTVDASTQKLELFLRDDQGDILGQFSAINAVLGARGEKLSFAMNAGMYHDDRSPVGHYIEDGQEVMRVISNAGPGNFGLLPNGVLCLRAGRADVFETQRYIDTAPECVHATQSGPMLVIDGALHPRFIPDGTSRYIRNGVGTSSDGASVVFAISEKPVNFHSFGTLFRDYLKTPNALYFDGNISRLYAPDINRSDFGFALGPIIGVVEPRE